MREVNKKAKVEATIRRSLARQFLPEEVGGNLDIRRQG
jgi:hypothetical protein